MRFGSSDRSNVEDRRGMGGGMGMRLGLGGTLVLAVLSLIFGQDLLSGTTDGSLPAGGGQGDSAAVERRKSTEANLEEVAVASFNGAQAFWEQTLPDRYRPSTLVLFWDGTRSGCGDASSAMGPFYCPLDQKVYIDLGFYRVLAERFGAAGEFANAYVIAHEVGHHVQHVIGLAGQVREAQERRPDAANALSVRMELQADCLAGAWARSLGEQGRLRPGDIDEGLRAASAVGDDRIQRKTTGRVQPESFTHGTAEQRASWFRRGYEGGELAACDTFAGEGEAPAQARRRSPFGG